MFALLFIALFVSAHNHEDLRKSFENMCGMPGNTSRLLHNSSWNEERCQKHVDKKLHDLKKQHLSSDEKKEIKKLLKEIKEDLKKEHHKLDHHIKTPWTIYLLDRTKYVALIATLASAVLYNLGDRDVRDVATVTAPISAILTLLGTRAHHYDHEKWIETIKKNYKYIKKAGEQF